MRVILVLATMALMNGTESVHNYIPCGRVSSARRTGKIVGGQDARKGEFPWLVSLTRRGGHFCGGSLLTKKFVLTAGHCMCSGGASIPVRQIKVTLSEFDLSKPSPGKYEVAVKSATTHPEYTCRKVRNDLAMLELEQELVWSEFVLPACLPIAAGESGYSKFNDVLATVAGWGWTDESNPNGEPTTALQKANVNIVETETCRQWYQSQGKKTKIQDTQMCAGHKTGGIDACWADSGGPLMVASGAGDQLVVVGVVSTGIGCARPFLPGLYTRVSEYIPWIRSVLEA